MFKNNRKLWIVVAGILLLSLVAAFLARRGSSAAAQDVQSGDTVTAFLGDMSASATASGELDAQESAALMLLSSGTVEEILVGEGDAVQLGDPLLRLETADLERAVVNAEQTLLIQEANLETLKAPPAAADIASAEAAVLSAEANLADLLDGPNADEIASAEASLRAAQADLSAAYARLNSQSETASDDAIRAAEIELELAQQQATLAAEQHSTILVTEPNDFLTQERIDDIELSARAAAVQANARLAAAQEALDNLRNGKPASVAASQASVTAAVASRDLAQTQLDLLLAGPTAVNIAAAEQTLAQAQAALDQLLNGVSAEQVQMSEVAVAQARISLQRAQLNLEQATLVAPFNGVITAVNVSVGEQSSGTLIEMVNTDSIEVVLEVDEVDIGEISVGQEAVVTLESWPGDEIEAAVASIAPRNNQNSGNSLVTYDVYLSLGQTELPILVGMTANANLITAQRSDVLLVPSAAITTDRQAGKYYVTRLNGEEQEVVEVTIGLRDGSNTQITSGIEAGDELLITSSVPLQTFGDGPPEDDGGPFGG